jgi:predicted nucleic acid-binding protein
MDGIAYVVEEWEKGGVVLVTSSITRVEVLDCELPGDAPERFRRALSRTTVHIVDVTRPVSNLAHEIRAHYQSGATFKVKTPDAIHLATAIGMECDAFLTFDGKSSKTGRVRRLLKLAPVVAGAYPLNIQAPRRPPPPEPEPQIQMFDKTTEAPGAAAPQALPPPPKVE